jgi:AcrR family transcriptional regulator
MPAKPQVIVRGRKFDQVLEGARAIFLRDGFERASVDDIAREAGVSKATLYAYFPDKRLLFLEIAKAECRRQADDAEALIREDAPVEEVLRLAAVKLTGFMASDFGNRIFRIAVAEASAFPALAHEFYEYGPRMAHDRLSQYLRCAVERGELQITDIDLAADQFMQLCKAGIHDRLVFGVGDESSCSTLALKRVIDGAVEMFLARYGRK